jgi:putative ABC transport system ATP-binding protein
LEPIIAARGLKKFYRTANIRIKALNGVDIEILPSESCAILGASGSGKSTLLSLLAGLEPPTGGKIYVKKRAIHLMTEKELVDFRLQHIGFVFQSFNLMGTMSAAENVALPLMFRGISRGVRMEAAKKLLVEMGLENHLRNRPAELSGGQQQRVSIARAIISRPEIIFADEPTGNLDSHTAAQIMDIISGVAHRRGATLVFVTHDVEKAAYADKVVHITDGRVDRLETGGRRPPENLLRAQGEKAPKS